VSDPKELRISIIWKNRSAWTPRGHRHSIGPFGSTTSSVLTDGLRVRVLHKQPIPSGLIFQTVWLTALPRFFTASLSTESILSANDFAGPWCSVPFSGSEVERPGIGRNAQGSCRTLRILATISPFLWSTRAVD